LSNGVPLNHGGDYGIYGVIDQMVWRLPGDEPKKGVGVFARLSASPSDRNLMDFWIDGGINFIGLWGTRPDDRFGLEVTYSRLSPSRRN
jgi:porin